MFRRKHTVSNRLILFPFLSLLLFFSSCNLFKSISDTDDQDQDENPFGEVTNISNSAFVGTESVFNIQFIQNGRESYLEEGIVKLNRAPFTINVIMQNTDGVYLNASLIYQERFEQENEFDDLSNIYIKVMAEPAFNKDRELYIDEENYSYWFYDENLDWHRLSDVRIEGNKVIGEKVIENFVMPNENRTMRVQDVRDDLFLFFFAVEDNLDEGFQVKQRQYIKIEWK